MTQGVSQQPKTNPNPMASMGSINRIGNTPEGRVIYQLVDGNGKVAGKVSVGAQSSDTFERTFKTITDVAPKIQDYAKKMTPQKVEQKKNTAKWLRRGMFAVGFLTPAILVKGKTWKQALITVAGSIAGIIAGVITTNKIMTPPGAKELNNATKTLQSLDVQPYIG